MRIITRKRLNEFAKKHPDAKSALQNWYQHAKTNQFNSFSEIRKIFGSADQVKKLTVFNISGNKFRLITAIHYNRKIIYIRAVLTHTEYDKEIWKE